MIKNQTKSQATRDIQVCKEYMIQKYDGKINFEFVEIEGEGEVGPILEKYIESEHSDAHLLVVGTRNKGALER